MLITLPLTVPTVDPGRPRKAIDPAADALLTDSIRRIGLIQAPGVRTVEGRYVLVWGERRVRCSIAAGLTEAAFVLLDKPMTESMFRATAIAENTARSDFTIVELIDAIDELAGLDPDLTNKRIAELLGLSETGVSKKRAIRACQVAYSGVRDGTLNAESAYGVAKASAANKAGVLALALNGATREELACASKQKPAAEKPTPSPDKKTRIVCPIAEFGVRVIVSGPAFEISGLIKILEFAASMARKAERDNLTVKLANETWKRQAAGKGRKAGA